MSNANGSVSPAAAGISMNLNLQQILTHKNLTLSPVYTSTHQYFCIDSSQIVFRRSRVAIRKSLRIHLRQVNITQPDGRVVFT